jgi:hypothetical protein
VPDCQYGADGSRAWRRCHHLEQRAGVNDEQRARGRYVALAEALDAPLVTCDDRLARAIGPMCEIVVP